MYSRGVIIPNGQDMNGGGGGTHVKKTPFKRDSNLNNRGEKMNGPKRAVCQ